MQPDLSTLQQRIAEAYNAMVSVTDLIEEARLDVENVVMEAKWLMVFMLGGKHLRNRDEEGEHTESFSEYEKRIERASLSDMVVHVDGAWVDLKKALNLGREASLTDCPTTANALVAANDEILRIHRLLFGTGTRPTRMDALFEIEQALDDLQREVGYPTTGGLLPLIKEALACRGKHT